VRPTRYDQIDIRLHSDEQRVALLSWRGAFFRTTSKRGRNQGNACTTFCLTVVRLFR
jgi:hypothetical protein